MTLRQLVSLVSLALLSTLILGYLWLWKFALHHQTWQLVAYGGAVALMLANHWYHRDRIRELGLRVDNLTSALVLFGWWTLPLCLLSALLGLSLGEFRFPGWWTLCVYFGWTLIQQHFLHNFLRRRSAEVLGPADARWSWAATLIAAGLFSLYHLPNPILVGVTFGASFLWCRLFLKTPNLVAAALSQTLITAVLLAFFKFGFLNQLHVGASGYRFDFYGDGVKVAAGVDESGQPFIATVPGPHPQRVAVVKVFRPGGSLLSEFPAFSEIGFSGEIAVGNLDDSAGDEIAVAAGPGPSNPPLVRIFSTTGVLLKEIVAPRLPARYGAWVAIACGRLYLSAGPGPRAPQAVRELMLDGQVTGEWNIAGLPLVNGVRATRTCGDSGQPEGPLLIWGTDVSINPADVFLWTPEEGVVRVLQPLETTFGLQATLFRSDGKIGVAGAPGPLCGYPPLIVGVSLSGSRLIDFAAQPEPTNCGATLASIDIDRDGRDELVLGQGAGAVPAWNIRIYSQQGELLHQWPAYSGSDQLQLRE